METPEGMMSGSDSYSVSYKGQDDGREWAMRSSHKELECLRKRKKCFEKATLQRPKTGLAAEEYSQENPGTSESLPIESFGIPTKESCKRLEDELEKTQRELQQCRKRLKEEQQKANHYQRKALIYKAHILHIRKIYDIPSKLK